MYLRYCMHVLLVYLSDKISRDKKYIFLLPMFSCCFELQLQLLAASRSIYPSISTDYQAKAESIDTITKFVSGNGKHFPRYLASTPVVYLICYST